MKETMEIEKNKNIRPVEWQAKEFQLPKRDTRWYILVTVILILGVSIALFYSQWLIVIVVLMAGVVLFLSNKMIPRTMNYRIDEAGVTINGHLIDYTNLKGFWFTEVEGKSYLNLITTTRLAPVITAEIDPMLRNTIKGNFENNIPELDENSEDWIDKVNRFLKV